MINSKNLSRKLYTLRTGNKDFGRKILYLKRYYGLQSEPELIRMIVHLHFQQVFSKNVGVLK